MREKIGKKLLGEFLHFFGQKYFRKYFRGFKKDKQFKENTKDKKASNGF